VTSPDLDRHLASFRDVWRGGFYADDPLDLQRTQYGVFGYLAVPYVIYTSCIKQYVGPDTTALEIGPGRGAWTRTLLGAREVWALDALSAEHNDFWSYVGDQPHVHYVEVNDFACEAVPDASIDYSFSYDALCHVPFDGIEAYATSLLDKFRPGAHAFWMLADFAKYRHFVDERRSVAPALVGQIGRRWLRVLLERVSRQVEDANLERHRRHIEQPEGPGGNWWYDAGTERTATMLEKLGYRVVDPDVGVDPRSPIVHFVRP
jgi:hypothetical protein